MIRIFFHQFIVIRGMFFFETSSRQSDSVPNNLTDGQFSLLCT